jgi:hypothetical protein
MEYLRRLNGYIATNGSKDQPEGPELSFDYFKALTAVWISNLAKQNIYF